MDQEIRFCAASDGVRIAYASVGSGPPVIKAANWLNHLEYDWESPVWRHLFEGLARDFRLIRYDERGNGLSDWDVDEISFDAFVRDLEAVVEATGLERFTLLGISQGAAVSIAYADRHPERVERLIIHGGYARGWKKRADPETVEMRRAMVSPIEKGWGKDNPAFRQLWTSLYLPGGTPEQFRSFNDLQRVSTSPANAIRIFEATSNIDVTGIVPRVTVHTLVTHCRGESVIPFSEGRWLAANLPNARLVGIDSRNHVLLGQEPGLDQFLSEVRSFMGADASARTAVEPAGLAAGSSFGSYQILEHLGTGGMGEVYRAEDTRLGRTVAIKILPREMAADGTRRARFMREARALAALKHPNIVTIYTVDEADSRPFLVMEMIEGRQLDTLIPEGGMAPGEFLAVSRPLLAAVAAAHASGVTHRDLKPQNVMVGAGGDLKVLDFGLAKFAVDAGTEVLTRENVAMGTLPYMSPEQVEGKPVDHRSDIFSLGSMLYEMATGKRPFRARYPAVLMASILQEHPPPVDLLNPAYPAGTARVISRCMEKDPGERFQSVSEIAEALGAGGN